jgi:hypothetical protein
MPEILVDDGSCCPACGADQPIDEEAVSVDVEYQGAIPLLVFRHRCPSCGHEWTRVLEPALEPPPGRNPSGRA